VNVVGLYCLIGGGIATTIALVGYAIRGSRALLKRIAEWIREEIVKPSKVAADAAQVAAFQLTANGGDNNPATVPDVAHEVRALRKEVAERARREEQRWVQHREWSDATLGTLNDRLQILEDHEAQKQ
jgi:hypothetical protein